MAGKAEFVVYKRKRGWYWKLVAPNHEIIAVGGEPFKSAHNAKRSIRRVRHYVMLGKIRVQKD